LANNRYLLLAAAGISLCIGATAYAKDQNPLDMAATIAMQIEQAKKSSELLKAMQEASQGLSLPAVVSLSLGEAGAIAQVIYPSGMPRMVRVGEVLQASTTVTDINLFGVTVRANGKTLSLPFYRDDAQASAENSPFVPELHASGGMRVPAPISPSLFAAPASSGQGAKVNDVVAPIPVTSVK